MENEDDFEEEGDINESKYLTFMINNQSYAITIKDIVEIIGIQKITYVPDMPVYVKGAINLRGEVFRVIDVRLRFGMAEIEHNDRTCIIVIKVEDKMTGLIVDSVSDVVKIEPDQVSQISTIQTLAASKYVIGLGKVNEDIKVILDSKKVVE